ncbi:hypothetical protein AKO1_007956 [Acrasis kona]|uniref:Uncharacterized protein n=1 Tax=Acrasis kona TaxID=1008807 RepID=A0AAW2YPQ7_9EUKA
MSKQNKDNFERFLSSPYPYIIIAGIGLFEFALYKYTTRSRDKYKLSFEKVLSELIIPEHWSNKAHDYRYEPESYNNSSITFTIYEENDAKDDGSHEIVLSELNDLLEEEETMFKVNLAQLHNSTVKVIIGFDAEEFNDFDWSIIETFIITNSRLPVDLRSIKLNLQKLVSSNLLCLL